jgi:hypothetical protein
MRCDGCLRDSTFVEPKKDKHERDLWLCNACIIENRRRHRQNRRRKMLERTEQNELQN